MGKEKQRIGIIGGGLTGLTSAYRLSKLGFDVCLFEADASIGGMIKGVSELLNSGSADTCSSGSDNSDHRNYTYGNSDPRNSNSVSTDPCRSGSGNFDPCGSNQSSLETCDSNPSSFYPNNAAPGGSDTHSLGLGYVDDIYHHLFTSDNYLLQLLEELGLKQHLRWQTAANALMHDGILYPFSTPLDLLRFKPIPFFQRLRTGLAVLKASRLKNWQPLENELASEWIRKNCGEEAWQTLWLPLLRSKFGSNEADVSAVWIWNKFKLRGSSREGSKEKLGYIEGGFQQIADRLKEEITAKGGQIHTCRQVTKIVPHESSAGKRQFGIETKQGTYSPPFDQIICTIAAEPFLEIASKLIDSVEYRRKLVDLEYKANICLSVIYEKSLSPWYWTTICDDLPFVVAVEQDNLRPGQLDKGCLVYFSRYVGIEEELWQESDQDITDKFVRAAADAFPGVANNKIITSRLVRTRYSQPVIKRHYSNKMPIMKTPVSGLWLAGMAQIYPEDRGMNYAVRLAEEVTTAVIGVGK
ncbi:MAG TPA: FAD-dependent oxidoreductase [Clostridiaceae bacterium]|nr:FAD-dependent oxidoreductase [Clostridiaceae bacterium]